ncbi:MAG: DEAD/DEAH box helicase family protein [Rhodoferax sp.]|nr:DEAD/DEAH box helicase family protein [Rhodoferax sp.]
MPAPSPSPILNGPYSEPLFHYATAHDGSLDYDARCTGRRIFSPQTPQVPLGQQAQTSLHDINDFAAQFRDELVNLLREQVGRWRAQAYPDVTSRVTRDLLQHWFLNPERPAWKKLFFAQQEAVETAIWLNEVAHRSNAGTHVLNRLRLANESVEDPASVLPRIASKMATGTGKTVVMACLLLYHYLNRNQYRNDPRYADYFLIVAPGITIRDRLQVLRVDTQAQRDADATDYYRERWLVPAAYASHLAGLNARLVITNFHAFEPRLIGGNKRSPLDGKIGIDGRKVEAREDMGQMLKRVLGPFKPGRRLLVINDEAHHCYLPRAKGKDTEEESSATENERAAVWFSGLREIARRWQLNAVHDLSATPYYLSGSGWPAYSYFPWVVSDFGLIEAIEAGLVKIPFLPVDDSSQELTEPTLRNLYEHCKAGLPRKGQRTQRKDDKAAKANAADQGEKSAVAPERPPELPALLKNALVQFYGHYTDYERGLRGLGERGKDLLTSPPVFIVVCSNTMVSKEVYKHIAGYETTDAAGQPYAVEGLLPQFSNFAPVTRARLRKPPTLLIDSDALENSGQVSDDFKRVFGPEIEAFKRDYRTSHPDKSVEALTDGDLLREVVNTVGRPGKLGEHIRCVVSVGMLTEGWDANTVTHIVGVRAFGSQLLCEQVAGRALRRRQYFLDPKTGLFPPEYAHIIGVPFKFFKGGSSELPQTQDIRQIRALPERAGLALEFPKLVGYKISHTGDRVRADFSATPRYLVNMAHNPVQTTLGTAFSAQEQELRTDIDALRDQEVVYWVAKEVMSRYFRDEASRPELEKFADIRQIAQTWYDQQVDVIGETDPRLRRLLRLDDATAVATAVYRGIEAAALVARAPTEEAAASPATRILPLYNRYNPTGSSAQVHGATVKPVYPTRKSHVNFVVADTDSWEQIAAKTFEQLDAVQSYVKNAFLGFAIPYVDTQGVERAYLPDFICRVKTPDGELFNLIVEITGFNKDKALKRYFTTERWLPAVNGQLTQPGALRWYFVEITDIERIKNTLGEAVERISTEVDEKINQTGWGVAKLIDQIPEDIFADGRHDNAAQEIRPPDTDEQTEREFWLRAQSSTLSSVWGDNDDQLFKGVPRDEAAQRY